MIENIYSLASQSTIEQLKYLQIPATQESSAFFGFIKKPVLMHPYNISLYDPVVSYILFFYSANIFFDTTGCLVNDTKGFDNIPHNWYNFFMSINSPFHRIQPIMLMENLSSSKSSKQMHEALIEWSNGYNLFWGKPVGKLYLVEPKFVHMDNDLATSNVKLFV